MHSLFIGSLLNWHLHDLNPFALDSLGRLRHSCQPAGSKLGLMFTGVVVWSSFPKGVTDFEMQIELAVKWKLIWPILDFYFWVRWNIPLSASFPQFIFHGWLIEDCRSSTSVVSLYELHPRIQIEAGKIITKYCGSVAVWCLRFAEVGSRQLCQGAFQWSFQYRQFSAFF